MNNRVSASLSAEQLTAIKNQIAEIKASLPFLISLNNDDISSMFKLGGKSLEFVQTAVQASKELVDLLPRNLDPAELERDYSLFQALESIRLALDPLLAQVESTQQAVGGDAMEAALEVYATLKRANRDSRAQTYLETMQARFNKKATGTA